MGFSVEGKTALVTGANRGIGKTIVESLLAAGATKVYAAVRRPESAQPLVDEHGDKVVPVEFDLEKPQTITGAAAVASDVQLVVNNAGVLRTSGPLDDEALDNLEYEFRINVYGLMRVAQAFAPVLKANGGGALVQLNSVVSLKNFANFATYSASKAASYSLTQALRDTLRASGTQVLSVHPGPIATDMADHAGIADMAEPPSLVADGIIEALAAGEFHLFPDTMARQFGEAYAGFADTIVNVDLMEA
ncbi:MAG: SDR family oxidoreductase [Planctomycetota bacterium]